MDKIKKEKPKSKQIDMEVDKKGLQFSDCERNTEGTNEQ